MVVNGLYHIWPRKRCTKCTVNSWSQQKVDGRNDENRAVFSTETGQPMMPTPFSARGSEQWLCRPPTFDMDAHFYTKESFEMTIRFGSRPSTFIIGPDLIRKCDKFILHFPFGNFATKTTWSQFQIAKISFGYLPTIWVVNHWPIGGPPTKPTPNMIET